MHRINSCEKWTDLHDTSVEQRKKIWVDPWQESNPWPPENRAVVVARMRIANQILTSSENKK